MLKVYAKTPKSFCSNVEKNFYNNSGALSFSQKAPLEAYIAFFTTPTDKISPKFEKFLAQSPKTLRRKKIFEVFFSSSKSYGDLEGIF